LFELVIGAITLILTFIALRRSIDWPLSEGKNLLFGSLTISIILFSISLLFLGDNGFVNRPSGFIKDLPHRQNQSLGMIEKLIENKVFAGRMVSID